MLKSTLAKDISALKWATAELLVMQPGFKYSTYLDPHNNIIITLMWLSFNDLLHTSHRILQLETIISLKALPSVENQHSTHTAVLQLAL